MIRNIGKVFKLMKYAHNLPFYIALMVWFAFLGIACLLLDPGSIGTFVAFIVLAVLTPIQCFYDFLFSGLVKSSPLSRHMEISINNLISNSATFITYLLVIAYILHHQSKMPDTTGELSANLFYSGLAVAVTLLYFSVCFKSFLLSTFGFFIGYMMVNFTMNIGIFPYPSTLSVQHATIWGIAFVMLGIVLSSLLRILVYKKPISTKAMGYSLRKHMQ